LNAGKLFFTGSMLLTKWKYIYVTCRQLAGLRPNQSIFEILVFINQVFFKLEKKYDCDKLDTEIDKVFEY
jgi:hypothetical protein